MRKIPFIVALIVLLSLVFGCGKGSDSAGKTPETAAGPTVAVVDLDKVAKAMGWFDDMKKNLQQTQTSITDQLKGALRPGELAFENKRDEIVKVLSMNPAQIEQLKNAKSKADLEKVGLSGKQIDELLNMMATISNDGAAASQQLNQVMSVQRSQIIDKFRDAARPAVRRVAMANNKSVVLTSSDNQLFFYDGSADITDKIIDDLQHSNAAKVEMPAIPVLNLQTPQPTVGPTTTKAR